MKTLISITTCNRLSELKKFIWEYLKFVNSDSLFDFVLGLDGKNQDYIDFAEKYNIPLIYSDEREGVGLSKNRVLSYFPNYDYYFFIEDDIELIEHKIFEKIILAHRQSGIHHFCNHHKNRMFDSVPIKNVTLDVCWTGGAQFAFFSNEGIKKVGGFNTLFAKYKRYGHTEHSYRYYHQKLQKGPFIFSKTWLNDFIIHSPPQVTSNSDAVFSEFGLVEQEQSLIDKKTTFFRLETISKYYFNQKPLGFNQKVEAFLAENPKKYPLTHGKARKTALAEHYALKIEKTKALSRKMNLFLKSMCYHPTNVALKHYIKTKIFGKR